MQKRALVLVNPHARNGHRPIDEALGYLERSGIEILQPDAALSPEEAIYRHRHEVDRVIVGGGDGSLNAAARALEETGLPLGILPLGTANDLARSLGIPKNLQRAAEAIVNGQLRPIDLGVVNDHRFFNVSSIGFSASLAKILTSEAKKRWGVLGYAIAACRLFRQSRPFTLHIEHDGTRETVKTIQVSVGNGRHYGGGMTVAEHAEPDDGKLDVYSLELDHWWEMLALLPYLRRGTHGKWKKVRVFSATSLTLETRRPHSINADGEIVGATPAHFSIILKAVSVYVPANQ